MSDNSTSAEQDYPSDAALTGAAVPVTIGGVEFLLSPLSDLDIVELDEWIRSRIIQSTAIAARELAKDMRDELNDRAIRIASAAGVVSVEGVRILSTIDGLARMIWQSTREHHPGVSYDDVRKLLSANTQDFELANTAIKRANNLRKSQDGAEKKRKTTSDRPEKKSTRR